MAIKICEHEWNYNFFCVKCGMSKVEIDIKMRDGIKKMYDEVAKSGD